MQFAKRDGWHEVAHIPGPRHNLLRLQFDDAPCASPVVEALRQDGVVSRLSSDRVVEHTLIGVRAAAEKLGREVHVTRVAFVVDDSPPESFYEQLAQRLTLHVFGEG